MLTLSLAQNEAVKNMDTFWKAACATMPLVKTEDKVGKVSSDKLMMGYLLLNIPDHDHTDTLTCNMQVLLHNHVSRSIGCG
jgi:hypothetical protein